jgi:hypothetical protein
MATNLTHTHRVSLSPGMGFSPDSCSISAVGNPTEVALLRAGRRAGMNQDDVLAQMPEASEVAFDRKSS